MGDKVGKILMWGDNALIHRQTLNGKLHGIGGFLVSGVVGKGQIASNHAWANTNQLGNLFLGQACFGN